MNQWHRFQPGPSRPAPELSRWLPPAMHVAAFLTAEVVPWCEQLYCDHTACTEELGKLAAKHRLTSGRFHGPVNLAVIEKDLWENYLHYAVTADAC